MDFLKDLEELKGFVGREIEKAVNRIRQNNGGITTGDLDIIDKLTHTMKSLVTTCAMLEAESDGYSGDVYRGYRQNGYSGSRYMMYGRDRRDGGYSRTDIREHLTQMMNDAPDENTRGEIRRMIDRMDNQR